MASPRVWVPYDDNFVERAVIAEINRINFASELQALLDWRSGVRPAGFPGGGGPNLSAVAVELPIGSGAVMTDLDLYPLIGGGPARLFPPWGAVLGPPRQTEDQLPIVTVYRIRSPNERPDKEASNIVQFWQSWFEIRLYCLGAYEQMAKARCRDAAACVINHWFGGNVYLGGGAEPLTTQMRNSGVLNSWLDQEIWSVEVNNFNEQFIAEIVLGGYVKLQATRQIRI